MAINLNPLLANGLAAFAGQNMPNLNLQSTAVDVGAVNKGLAGGILAGAELQQKQQQLAQALMIAKLREEEAMKRQAMQAQVSLANNQNTVNATMRGQDLTAMTAADRLAQDREFKEIDVGMKQQEFNLDSWYKQSNISARQQELLETTFHNEFNRQMKLDDVKRENEQRIYGGFLVNAMKNKDPEALAEAQKAAVEELVKNGYMDENEAVKALKASPQDFTTMANMRSIVGEKVAVAKASAPQFNMNPDGTMTVGATSTTTNEVQKNVINKEVQQKQLDSLEASVKSALSDPKTKDIFTAKGDLNQYMIQKEERGQGIPIVGDAISGINKAIVGYTPKQRSEMLQTYDKAKTQVNMIFNAYRKEITGAAAAVQELDRLQQSYLNNEMSISQYYARMQTIRDMGKQELNMNKDVLSNGISVNKDTVGTQQSITSPDRIRVKNKDGQTGWLDANEFDPNLYTRIK